MPFPRDSILDLSMTLVRLSGAKSLRYPLVSQLLGEWVASCPLARARWSEATHVGYPSLIRTKQVDAVKQYASFLFPAPNFFGLLMDLNVTETGFRHLSNSMTRRGIDYTAAMGHTFPRPIPTQQAFLDTWKDMAKPLELQPPVNVDDPPASGRNWPVHSWARYIQSRPPLVDTIDWVRPLILLCAGMPTRVPVGVGPNCLLSSANTANGAAHPRTCGLSGCPCAGTKTWPIWPLFGPRTFRYFALLCRIEFGLASFQISSFKSKKLLEI